MLALGTINPLGQSDQQGRKDLNPVREFWRLAALPGAHPYDKDEGGRMKDEGGRMKAEQRRRNDE
jgi:hypothetical protein